MPEQKPTNTPGLDEFGRGVTDGQFLAKHLDTPLLVNLVRHWEHTRRVNSQGALTLELDQRAPAVESDYRFGTRIAVTAALDGRDSTWRIYSELHDL